MSENKTTVERYMAGFNTSDHALILSCLTDDVEWDIPGAFHLVGKEAFDKEIENDAFVGRPTVTVTMNAVFCDVFLMREARIRRLASYLVEVK